MLTAVLTWENLKWSFCHFLSGNWHPLTVWSHILDCQLYGLNPWGHHLTSLLFHAANSVLLFLWLHRLTGALWRSAWVAAIFAFHPLHVESVAWVAERKDVLSTFFGVSVLAVLYPLRPVEKQPCARIPPPFPAGQIFSWLTRLLARLRVFCLGLAVQAPAGDLAFCPPLAGLLAVGSFPIRRLPPSPLGENPVFRPGLRVLSHDSHRSKTGRGRGLGRPAVFWPNAAKIRWSRMAGTC